MQKWGFFSMGIMAGIIVVLFSALLILPASIGHPRTDLIGMVVVRAHERTAFPCEERRWLS